MAEVSLLLVFDIYSACRESCRIVRVILYIPFGFALSIASTFDSAAIWGELLVGTPHLSETILFMYISNYRFCIYFAFMFLFTRRPHWGSLFQLLYLLTTHLFGPVM